MHSQRQAVEWPYDTTAAKTGTLTGRRSQTSISSAVLTQRSKAPSRAGVAAALATGVATATLTHAGSGNAAPG